MNLNLVGEMSEMAWRDLVRKKTRSFLTALGVIFGIASVVSMMAVGEGAQNQILDQIKGMGLNNIVIKSVKPKEETKQSSQHSWIQSYGLKFKDAQCLKETLPTLENLTILKNHSGRAWHGSRKIPIELKGVEDHFFKMVNMEVKGRKFTSLDNAKSHNVCIAPRSLLTKLGLPQKVNTKIRVSEKIYTIVGIFDDAELPTALVSDYGPSIFVPIQVGFKKLGLLDVQVGVGSFQAVHQEVSEIICRIVNEDDVESTALWIEKILKKNHPRLDFSLVVPLQLLKQKQQTQQIFNIVMILIAAISLIVGGIGIINIMLATISERTREIGVRRAIGATKQDIIMQFLTETLMLTVLAGIAGCILGVVIINLIESTTGWDAVVHPTLFVWAFLISCFVGIGFGLYPAKKAAELDPIESLRYE
ncbi:MAG: ABC transporter permease [Planctomycetes bacterium]|nr:ABC transporter permease [Planctomycetota bacterium]